jgi:hypothetical protein
MEMDSSLLPSSSSKKLKTTVKPYSIESLQQRLGQLEQNFNLQEFHQLVKESLAFYQTGQQNLKSNQESQAAISLTISAQILAKLYHLSLDKITPNPHQLVHQLKEAYHQTMKSLHYIQK